MISCKETNIGSAKTIENNFGIQTDLIYIEAEQMNFKKYWIDVNESINKFGMNKRRSI